MPATRAMPGRRLGYDEAMGAEAMFDIAVEVPVSLVYGGLPHVVMMASPGDIEDLIYGFSLTEGIVETPAGITALSIREERGAIIAEIALQADAMQHFLSRRRNMTGRTSCGLCGVESLDQLASEHRLLPGPRIGALALQKALDALESAQVENRKSRAMHAAGWFSPEGEAILVREDVGRHNALDKMVGGCLRAGTGAKSGFAVISSRCSFEMVEKAAAFGASTLVAVSAPTSLAIERARASGLRLIAVARRDGAIVFTDGENAEDENFNDVEMRA